MHIWYECLLEQLIKTTFNGILNSTQYVDKPSLIYNELPDRENAEIDYTYLDITKNIKQNYKILMRIFRMSSYYSG